MGEQETPSGTVLEVQNVEVRYPEPHCRDKSGHQQRIESFMTGCKQQVPLVPCVPDEKTRLLRARLILEEALETVLALGIRLRLSGEPSHEPAYQAGDEIDMEDLWFDPSVTPNLVEIADGCADISVVTYGTLSACGIADDALIVEVDKNNLTKLEKGTVDEHGKLTKPPGHQPPEIEKLLKEQGWSK